MGEPANDIPVVSSDRLNVEARLTRLEVSNKHILYLLNELREGLDKVASELHEMRGELNARNNPSDGNNDSGVLRYVVIALVSALLSLVGVKLAGGM